MSNILVKQGKEIGGIAGSLAAGASFVKLTEGTDYTHDFEWISFNESINQYDAIYIDFYSASGITTFHEEQMNEYMSYPFIIPVRHNRSNYPSDVTNSTCHQYTLSSQKENTGWLDSDAFGHISIQCAYDDKGYLFYSEFDKIYSQNTPTGQGFAITDIYGIKSGSR